MLWRVSRRRRLSTAVLLDFPEAYEVSNGAGAIVIATDWNEFRNLDVRWMRSRMRGAVLWDCRNVFEPVYPWAGFSIFRLDGRLIPKLH